MGVNVVGAGSPARAGIGPHGGLFQGTYTGFPRASGDRPYRVAIVSKTEAVPPRERG